MTPEDELIERSQPPESIPCANCGHGSGAHIEGECLACDCRQYGPLEASDLIAEENGETI